MILLQLIGYILVIIFIIIVIKHSVKKCDTFLEKFLLITIGSIIIVLPYFIYITDYFNIPSLLIELGILKNLNIEFWKDFTSSYIATIAGTILSGAIVLFITKIQLDRTKNDNREALNEEKRLSNQYKQAIHLKYNLKFNNKNKNISHHENLKINVEDEELLINNKNK